MWNHMVESVGENVFKHSSSPNIPAPALASTALTHTVL